MLSHRLGSGTQYQPLPAIADGSRSWRSLTRHQGVGASVRSLAVSTVGSEKLLDALCLLLLKHASAPLLVTAVSLESAKALALTGPFPFLFMHCDAV